MSAQLQPPLTGGGSFTFGAHTVLSPAAMQSGAPGEQPGLSASTATQPAPETQLRWMDNTVDAQQTTVPHAQHSPYPGAPVSHQPASQQEQQSPQPYYTSQQPQGAAAPPGSQPIQPPAAEAAQVAEPWPARYSATQAAAAAAQPAGLQAGDATTGSQDPATNDYLQPTAIHDDGQAQGKEGLMQAGASSAAPPTDDGPLTTPRQPPPSPLVVEPPQSPDHHLRSAVHEPAAAAAEPKKCLSVTIESADPLEPERVLVTPTVRLHVVNPSNGNYLAPSNVAAEAAASAMTGFETPAFNLAKSLKLQYDPHWQHQLVLPLTFEDAAAQDALLLFEIVQQLPPRSPTMMRLSSRGAMTETSLAWGFLRLTGERGMHVGSVRLKLYRYVTGAVRCNTVPLRCPRVAGRRFDCSNTILFLTYLKLAAICLTTNGCFLHDTLAKSSRQCFSMHGRSELHFRSLLPISGQC